MGSETRPADAPAVPQVVPPTTPESAGRKRRRNFEPEAKAKAIMRVLAGEPKASVAAELGVSVDRMERWQSTFYNAGVDALAKKSSTRTSVKFKPGSGTIGQWLLLALILVASIIVLVRMLTP
jgi:hypothetical protein